MTISWMSNLLDRLAIRLPLTRKLMDETGRLQDELDKLRSKPSSAESWVPAGHFYSPVVNPADELVERAMESEAHPETPLEALGIDEERMLEWFEVTAALSEGQPFPELPDAARGRYHYSNPNFPLADALALLAFMVRLRPRRFFEAGSGFSSCAAIDINERYLDGAVELTFIDPYPELALVLIGEGSSYADRFSRKRLQDVPLEVFQTLEQNDILFIDSSHVGKTGSDVLDYLFRIFPSLAPGVVVHIHDIFYPFEYPRAWIQQENRSWNEAYFVRAFLQGNPSARVLYMSDWFYKCRRSLLESRMPLCIPHRGGSLWIEVAGRRKPPC